MSDERTGPSSASRGLPAAVLGALLVALATGMVLSAHDVFAGLVARVEEVAGRSPLERRRLHDGWFVRMEPVVAAIEARVPAQAPVIVAHPGVPAWFVVARLPDRAFYEDAPDIDAVLRAAGTPPWRLVLRPGEPIDWSLEPPADAPRRDPREAAPGGRAAPPGDASPDGNAAGVPR